MSWQNGLDCADSRREEVMPSGTTQRLEISLSIPVVMGKACGAESYGGMKPARRRERVLWRSKILHCGRLRLAFETSRALLSFAVFGRPVRAREYVGARSGSA